MIVLNIKLMISSQISGFTGPAKGWVQLALAVRDGIDMPPHPYSY